VAKHNIMARARANG